MLDGYRTALKRAVDLLASQIPDLG
jgi:hypothetical protein